MPSLSYKIGADNSGLINGLAQSQRAVDNFKKKAAASAGGARGGGGRFALANVSMQAQDIAVQMQMGARGATIIAQQGSQLLSAFGPTGALAGGVLAIGAGIYSWATNAQAAEKAVRELAEATKAARAEIAQSDVALAKTIASADVMAAERQFGKRAGERMELSQRQGAQIAEVEDSTLPEVEKARRLRALARLHAEEADAMAQKFRAQDDKEKAEIAEKQKKAYDELHQKNLDNLAEMQDRQAQATAADLAAKKEAHDRMVEIETKRQGEIIEQFNFRRAATEKNVAALGNVNDAIAAAKAAGEAAEMDERIRIAGQDPAARRAEKKATREKRSDEDRAIAAKIRDENEARRQKGQGPMTEDERNARRGQLRGDIDKRKQDAQAAKILGNIYDEIKGLAGKIDAA